eukprot:TRINITY_DN429_c1_g1_i2.p1 TRINITY_DN429_c1_g1~~TRINITY_DN429_c1_g1_i2.p1  ORF type:complete len:412 (-),score=80.09 TRINITY_DN429_c1_g1_i2:266-1501(-)
MLRQPITKKRRKETEPNQTQQEIVTMFMLQYDIQPEVVPGSLTPAEMFNNFQNWKQPSHPNLDKSLFFSLVRKVCQSKLPPHFFGSKISWDQDRFFQHLQSKSILEEGEIAELEEGEIEQSNQENSQPTQEPDSPTLEQIAFQMDMTLEEETIEEESGPTVDSIRELKQENDRLRWEIQQLKKGRYSTVTPPCLEELPRHDLQPCKPSQNDSVIMERIIKEQAEGIALAKKKHQDTFPRIPGPQRSQRQISSTSTARHDTDIVAIPTKLYQQIILGCCILLDACQFDSKRGDADAKAHQDGLSPNCIWNVHTFVNGPWSRLYPWVYKAVQSAQAYRTLIVMLVPTRCSSRWWLDLVLPNVTKIIWLERIQFEGDQSKLNESVCLIFFDGRQPAIRTECKNAMLFGTTHIHL